jgi:RNA polymerase sigma-70 factor, ECF subfamily
VSASEDQADVERVLAGDVSAFEGIVRRWQSPLINLAFRFFGDRGRAEEMSQEAFLRAYRALGAWRKDAAFSTWLFALATNLYRSELKRIPAGAVSLTDVPELRAARAGAGKLEDEDRFYFHDMDIPAAARSLGLPEGTVKARLSRGREILRGKLPLLLSAPRLKEA